MESKQLEKILILLNDVSHLAEKYYLMLKSEKNVILSFQCVFIQDTYKKLLSVLEDVDTIAYVLFREIKYFIKEHERGEE